MKKISFTFWASVAGIAVCLAMTIYTAATRKEGRVETQTAPQNIPIPAE